MLRKLRLKLTLLYLLVSAGFIVLLGSGLYFSLHNYFQSTTDLALKYRLMLELRRLNQPVPANLAGLKYVWIPSTPTQTATQAQTPTALPTASILPHEYDDDGEYWVPPTATATTSLTPIPTATIEPTRELIEQGDAGISFEGELAAVFIMPIDIHGALITQSTSINPPITPDENAIQTAQMQGMDLRSIRLSDGSEARLLTYRLPASTGVIALQVGRLVSDQQRLLNQYLWGIMLIGATSLLLMGFGSWWLAGRSILPAQRAFDRQQAFVANASHELRTPLTLIHSSAELASKQVPEGETKRYMDDVIADTDYMSRMVEDLLLLSRLDAKKLAFVLQPVDLGTIFHEIESKVERITGPRGIAVTAASTDLKVRADPDRLQQVLWILISNAIEHTPEGGKIILSAHKEGKNVRIDVTDNGKGISPRVLPHIFERFFRGEHRSEDRGAGLGLSIAQGLVDAMKGKISVESKVGFGTRVSIKLESARE